MKPHSRTGCRSRQQKVSNLKVCNSSLAHPGRGKYFLQHVQCLLHPTHMMCQAWGLQPHKSSSTPWGGRAKRLNLAVYSLLLHSLLDVENCVDVLLFCSVVAEHLAGDTNVHLLADIGPTHLKPAESSFLSFSHCLRTNLRDSGDND